MSCEMKELIGAFVLGGMAGVWLPPLVADHGAVMVYHNIDEGTPLNHGQASIHVRLPRGTKFDENSTLAIFVPQWQTTGPGCAGDVFFDEFGIYEGNPHDSGPSNWVACAK